MRSVALVVALVLCVQAGLWTALQRQQPASNIENPLASVSYSPYIRSLNDRPTEDQIRRDLKILSPYTQSVRTYSSTGGAELVPAVAAELGLKVTLGIWIDNNAARNEREITAAIALARRYSNINAIVVGNETIFRGEKTIDDLVKLIQRVKRQTSVPVTTGEIWSVWIEHPELASQVDFIAAHILPYWEGVTAKQAVNYTLEFYEKLRRAHPGKRIVIAEFGWPSGGYNFHKADPGRIEQTTVLRDFISRAEAYGIDYNIIEAFDQPWKSNEGSVGMYWGLFDASRHAKFSWTGPAYDADYRKTAGLALLLSLLLCLPIFKRSAVTVGETAMLAGGANVAGAWFASVFAFWDTHYFMIGAAVALTLGLALLIPLMAIALARIEEIAAIAFGRTPRRLLPATVTAPAGFAPKVSVHIPAYREPPEMLKATLDAVARLDYPNFECVVVINNTPDPAFWRPIENHCRTLGERFKFVHDDNVKGFKAGALRLALEHTAPDVEIIGVIDADYVVQPSWLTHLVPAFSEPKVGMVQAPQDHRDGTRSVMHHAMNGEYAGFFDIGMVQRNEANAIIIHGTMCLVRRSALAAAGSWSSDTIVEDCDLGLIVLEQGWAIHYTNRRYGHGLLPDTFDAYKKQRHRWAYGGLQILKKHWRFLLPGAAGLTRAQKREFAFGWLNWLGAEALGVQMALLNIVWAPVVAFLGIAIPDKVLTVPILAAFTVTLVHFLACYRLRVGIRPAERIGAVIAAMSVQWTVARAVAFGIWKEGLPFLRTAKGGATGKGPGFSAAAEGLMALLLVTGAALVVYTNYTEVVEVKVFALVLAVQSLPFFAAVAIAALESSPFNDFAWWRTLSLRLAALRRFASLPKPVAILPREVGDGDQPKLA
jgi:exo-beta-1,3-glucanase (GH17 family)/cellulose synthase/poly-beta-1,6-N-acetylglucosamine synthase-like glycosyltransferase